MSQCFSIKTFHSVWLLLLVIFFPKIENVVIFICSINKLYLSYWINSIIKFKCCGVNNYGDFAKYAPNWDNTPDIDGTPATTLLTPVACCVTIPDTAVKAQNCAGALDSTLNNYEKVNWLSFELNKTNIED